MLIKLKLYRILLTFLWNHNYYINFNFNGCQLNRNQLKFCLHFKYRLECKQIEQIVPKVQFGPVLVLFGTRRTAIAYALHWPQETEICSTCHEHHFWSPYRGALLFGLWLLLLTVVVVAVGRAAADRRMRWNKFQPRNSHVLYAALLAAATASGVCGKEFLAHGWLVAGWWFGYHFQCSRPKLFAYKHSLRTFIVSILTSLIKTSS